MKVYVTVQKEKTIENFKTIYLPDFDEEMSKIVPNSCELIVLDGTLDYVSHDTVDNLLKVVNSKLRKNGTISLNGFDLGLITRHVMNGEIDESQFSSVIRTLASMHYMKTIISKLSELKLQIEQGTINGIKYEITAKR